MIKSILLAVDGSVYTDSVLKHGIDWAKKLDAHLRVVSVVDVRIYEWVLNTGGEGYMPVIPSNVFHDESFKFHNERAESMLTTVSDKIKKDLAKEWALRKSSGILNFTQSLGTMSRQELMSVKWPGDINRGLVLALVRKTTPIFLQLPGSVK